METVHLARELTKEFYSEKDGEPLYRDVRTTPTGGRRMATGYFVR
jgi:hypothetical protein